MDTTEVYMVRSAKGNDMLCVDSFLYHYEDRGNNSYRWVCNKRKDKMLPCRSRIVTTLVDDDETKHLVQKVVGDHTHGKCSADEIFKAFERKRIANLAGEPCTLENKTLKRKMKRIEEFEQGGKQRKKNTDDDWDGGVNYVDEDDDDDEDGTAGQRPAIKDEVNHSNDEEVSLPSMFNFEPEKVYMFKTSNGRQMLCFNGFLYRLARPGENGKNYCWVCVRRSIACKAHIKTDCLASGEHTVQQSQLKEKHNHEPYTPGKLSKLISEHNLNVVTEIDESKASKHNADGFEEVTFSPQRQLRNKASGSGQGKTTATKNNTNDSDSDDSFRPTPARVKKDSKKTRPKAAACNYQLSDDPLAGLNEGPNKGLHKNTFTFLPSAKGNKVLCLDNYIYHFDSRSNLNGRSYWTCTQRRDKRYKCNGRVTTQTTDEETTIVKVSGVHKHPDSTNDIKRRLYKSVVAKKANETQLKPSEILESSMNELGDDFKEIVAKSKESIERRIGRLRMKMRKTAMESFYEKTKDDSTSSFSSALESDDDHLDFSALPTKLEEMYENEHDSTDDVLEVKFTPKEESFLEEAPMEEEYLESTNFEVYETENDFSAVDMLSVTQDIDKIVKYGSRKKADDDGDNEPDMDITKVSMLRSAKGGELLCVDGYIYHLKSVQNMRTYWTCIKCKDRVMSCKSRVATINTSEGIMVFKVTNRHTHPVNETDIKRRLYNEYTKGAAPANSSLKPRHILDKPLHEISEVYADLIANSKGARERRISAAAGKDRKIMKLYSVSDGPPSLAVRMTLKALGIPFELSNVDFIASEHLSEEYAKMNPQKEIPVLDDNGFYLSESVAIMQYLCDKYAKSESNLYPIDATERAVVNHRLCFNMGFYYSSISAYTMAPIFFDYPRTEMGLKKVNNSLAVFETYLERAGTKYAAAEHLTIADFALVSATLCLEAIGYDLSPYPLIKEWYETFKEEYPELWAVADGGMQEIVEFEKNPPDMSHMNHPFHPTRKPEV